MSKSRSEYEAQTKHPGKFESEQPWVPYFWERALDGGSDETVEVYGEQVDLFTVTTEDHAIFPELAVGQRIALRETDSGFVMELDAKAVAQELEQPDPYSDPELRELAQRK